MPIDEKQWASIREAFVYWANKRKANSVRSYASAREAIIALADNDYKSNGGGGEGDSLFTAIIDENTGDTVGAKALYDLHIIQEEEEPVIGSESGTTEVLKNITEILRHISLQVIGEGTADEHEILVSDLTFASEGNIISGGVDGGGGSPGGSIATLADVTLDLTSLDVGHILIYGNDDHWHNHMLNMSALNDFSGTPSNGQTLIYNSSNGKWMPGNAPIGSVTSVGLTMPTGFLVTNTPVTGSGSLTVSFDDGYSLPTTAKQTAWDTAATYVTDLSEAHTLDIIRHLSLVVLNEGTANERTILVSDITFASEGNVVAGGTDDAGGGGGGGSIATLADVTIDLASLDVGHILMYGNDNHWHNRMLNMSALNDYSGTPSNGQTLIYSSSSGKWMPGNAPVGSVTSVGLSMPTGFSVTNTPVTGSGTLTVSFASGYSLLTSTQSTAWDSAASYVTDLSEAHALEIIRHLSLVVLNSGTANERTILKSDITFASEGNVVAGGTSSGGGGGGGGSIATLADVTLDLTTLDVGHILVYGNDSHWHNIMLNMSALTDVDGTPSNGQMLIYNSISGKWIPGTPNVGTVTSVAVSMPTGFSVTGSPITTSGTISVSFSSGYSLPTTTKQSQWDDAYSARGKADYNSSSKALATQEWVTGKGYLTSAVTSLNSLTGGVTLAEGSNISISKSGSTITIANTYSYSHPTNGANTTITAANGKVLSAITVNNLGHVTSVSSKTLAAVDIPDLSGSYLTISGGTLTGDLRLKNSGSYGLTLYFGDASYVYLNEDTDDHLKMYASKGFTMLTSSTSYGVVIGSSSTATPATLYGTLDVSGNTTLTGTLTVGTSSVNKSTTLNGTLSVSGNTTMEGTLTVGTTSANKSISLYGSTSSALTIYGGSTSYSTNIYRDSSALRISSAMTIAGLLTVNGNLAVGASSSTSDCKTAYFYGRTSSSYPAITIYGVASGSTNYSTSLYRDATWLQVTTGVYVSGNFVATGNVTSGNSSDRRLKKDIRDISMDDAEHVLSHLHPVSFNWNHIAEKLSDGVLTGEARGFLADEYLEEMPNAGRKMWGDYDAIYYEQTIPYLVAGWQQQSMQLRILKDEINILKEDNKILRRRLRSKNVIQ